MNNRSQNISCGREYAAREYHISNISVQIKKPEDHVSYITTHSAFIITLEGSAAISFDGKTFLAKKSKVIHGAPGKKLLFDVHGSSPFVHLNIYYDPDGPWSGDSDWMRSLYDLSIKNNDPANRLVEELKQSSENTVPDSLLRRELAARQLIRSLFNEGLATAEAYVLMQSAEYIRTTLGERHTLTELAKRANMNKAHYSYMFRKMFGIGPIDYCIHSRLSKATELLVRGTAVNEAAEAVGYADSLYFSRLYKKHTGVRPVDVKNGIISCPNRQSALEEIKTDDI